MPFPLVPIITGATQVVRMVAPRVAKMLIVSTLQKRGM
jgi:hypothetical protein